MQGCRHWGCRGCHGRSVDPISTRGDRLCPPNYYWHPRIFRPSDSWQCYLMSSLNQVILGLGFPSKLHRNPWVLQKIENPLGNDEQSEVLLQIKKIFQKSVIFVAFVAKCFGSASAVLFKGLFVMAIAPTSH